MKNAHLAAIAALSIFLSPFAGAAEQDELAQIRAQLKQMKMLYEQRISALEDRLAQAERRTGGTEPAVPPRAPLAPLAAAPGALPPPARPISPGTFNPEISLILSGNYTRLSKGADERRFQGIMPSSGERLPEARSFHLGESELSLSANIDPLFRGNFRLSIAPDNSIGIEEAHIQTLGLGNGLNLKAGRFLSGVGYLNERHPHEWDFSDAPLPYQAFFGNALGMDGVQARWLAPSEMFLEFGLEAARARSFPTTDETRDKNGAISGAAFVHAGHDVGLSNSWRAGLSYFAASPRKRVYEDPLNGVHNSFSGRSRTWVADVIWKWAPNGNDRYRNLKIQGEYFSRPEKGTLVYDTEGSPQSDRYKNRSSGFYAQAVYQFMPRWRVGYRYDQLQSGRASLGLVQSGALTMDDFPLLKKYHSKRSTLMLDWSPSEFSRIRLQFAQDRTRPETTDRQFWLQYIMSMGAHGAHKF